MLQRFHSRLFKTGLFNAGLITVGLVTAGLSLLPASLPAAANPASNSPTLTLYQAGSSLVQQQTTLPAGQSQVTVKGIAPTALEDSIRLQPLNGWVLPVLQQQFQFDTLKRETLLPQLVGQTVSYKAPVNTEGLQEADEFELKKGTLLRAPRRLGSTRLQRFVLIQPEGQAAPELVPTEKVLLQQVPASFVWEPTLTLQLQSPLKQAAPASLTYLAGRLGWQAHYYGQLNADETQLSLNGWVTLRNFSGQAFNKASIHLIAGELQRDTRHAYRRSKGQYAAAKVMAADAAYEAAPTISAVSDLYRYSLPNPVTLPSFNEVQVPWLQGATLNTQARYVYQVLPQRAHNDKHPAFEPLQHWLEVNNQATPLPAGLLRVYQPDAQGTVSLLGEEGISHISANTPFKVKLGRAFDVKAQSVVLSSVRDKNHEDQRIEVTLKNLKPYPALVEVKSFPSEPWRLLDSSKASRPPSAEAPLSWEFNLAPGQTESFTYTVRRCWGGSKLSTCGRLERD